MQFFDTKQQYRSLKKEIDAAVMKTLESGAFIGGDEITTFENEIESYLNVSHAITLNSGTDALYLALKALGIGPGDEVIVPDFTFIATAETAAQCGAAPVFADIDPVTLNIDCGDIKRKITSRTKAIIPVHLFGRAADMEMIMKIAKEKGLFVVEDVAQAIGAQCGGKFCGAIGDAGCFSFFPTKNLGAFGDGGMVATNNAELADRIKLLRSHGSSPANKYIHLAMGLNSRLDSLQAAILRVKLPHLNDWNSRRIENAARYNENLAGTGDIILPRIGGGSECVFHQYTILTERRDELQNFLKERQIPTMVYYSMALHAQPAFANLLPQKNPNAEYAAQRVISLPIYPELSEQDQEAVIGAVNDFYDGK